MLFLLSPAKKLDYNSPLPTKQHTQPQMVPQAEKLIHVLRQKSPAEIQKLMKLSDALTTLNVQRYEQWESEFSLENARQAVLAFNGDVYEGLQASEFSDTQLDWLQQHALILSGLYGVLRPLDLMQPYRLEMGTRLATDAGKNLYEYWGNQIAQYINQTASQETVVVNLASKEYFKAVDLNILNVPVIECVFQEQRGDDWKIISFHAKKARGLMVRYAVENHINTINGLKAFDLAGYQFAAEPSTESTLVFRRSES